MPSDPDTPLARSSAIVRIPARPAALAPFCASPTVLEAINHLLRERGMPTLWVQRDGTIGPTDPLFMRMTYDPSPFVC